MGAGPFQRSRTSGQFSTPADLPRRRLLRPVGKRRAAGVGGLVGARLLESSFTDSVVQAEQRKESGPLRVPWGPSACAQAHGW